MGQIDQSDHGDRDIGIPALPEMAASICRAFCPSRSAVISTLESRISPMRAVRAARDDFRKLPPHPWRSQRRWSPSSLQLATRSLQDGPARRYWCMDHRHGQLATLDHDFRTRAHPCQQPSDAGGFHFRCGSHGQPRNDYAVIPRVQILPLKPPAVPCGLGCTFMRTPFCHSRIRTGRGSRSRSVCSLGRKPQGMGIFLQMHHCRTWRPTSGSGIVPLMQCHKVSAPATGAGEKAG